MSALRYMYLSPLGVWRSSGLLGCAADKCVTGSGEALTPVDHHQTLMLMT